MPEIASESLKVKRKGLNGFSLPASEGTHAADTLISPELRDINFYCLNHPVCGNPRKLIEGLKSFGDRRDSRCRVARCVWQADSTGGGGRGTFVTVEPA